MPGMLYYPFAIAPTKVVQQAVLYWDNLSTVVAPDWWERVPRGSPMAEVVANGFFRPVEPYEAYESVPLAMIEPELEHVLRLARDRRFRLPVDPPRLDQGPQILHADKLHRPVARRLISRGLLRPHPSSPSRLYGSPELVNVVISIVAAQIAATTNSAADGQRLHPHTDQDIAHQISTDPLDDRPVTRTWQVDIGDLLLTPRDDVPIGDLFAFRERHDDERRRMMVAVQDLLRGFRDEPPRDAYERLEHELREARNDLLGAAKAKKVSFVKRHGIWVTVSLAAALAAEMAGVGAATGVVLGAAGNYAINMATGSARDEPNGAVRDHNVYRYLHSVESKFPRSGVDDGS